MFHQINFGFMLKKYIPTKIVTTLKILLKFSTSYLCEQGFSILLNIKINKRMKMEFIEEENMRVCLSTIRP